MSNESKKDIEITKDKSIKSNGLLAFLVKTQEKYSTIIHLKLYDDGSGSIVHTPYYEEEIIVEFQNIEELDKLIKS